MQKRFVQGFTLIEILLVIGIIAILATVVIVALDPAQRFQDSRDARRRADVESISKAIQQYIIDNKGSFPNGLTEDVEQGLGTSSVGCDISTNGCNSQEPICLDLTGQLERYLKAIPYDPQGAQDIIYYTIVRNSNNIVTVKACKAEGDDEISLSQ